LHAPLFFLLSTACEAVQDNNRSHVLLARGGINHGQQKLVVGMDTLASSRFNGGHQPCTPDRSYVHAELNGVAVWEMETFYDLSSCESTVFVFNMMLD
jgi:hypothetical protein